MHLPAANFRFHAAVFTLCSPSPLWTLLPGRLSLPCPPFSRPSPFNPPRGREAAKACECPVNCLFIKMSSQPDREEDEGTRGRGDEVSRLDIYFYLRAASLWRRKSDVEVIVKKPRTIQTANHPWIYYLDIFTRYLTYVLSALIFCYPWNTRAAGSDSK